MNKINKTKIKTNQSLEDDVVLRVEHLSKKFCRTLKRSMYYGTIDIARSMLGINYDTGKLRKDEFWALDDVSFELKKGETLGIIGVNGSGKSTLLRLITGIFPPDKGKISFKGRIGALIAVGAGFHPHMTGLENIYLNGTILGMTRKELDAKMDEIIDFADIGDFLDAPVNTYSSGMRVRLGFAIAVHCEPDILLVDEVLSVGDISFRNKSMRKMAELKEKAKGLIFISHNLDQIRVLCSRVIVMEEGNILFDGGTDEGLIKYENMSKDKRVSSINKEYDLNGFIKERRGDGERVVTKFIGVLTANHKQTKEIKINDSLNVFIDFVINEYCEEIYFSVVISNEKRDVHCIWVKSNDTKDVVFKNIDKGSYRIKVSFPQHHLAPGVYFVNYAIRNSKTSEIYEQNFTNVSFNVKSDNHYERGIILAEESWNLESLSNEQ